MILRIVRGNVPPGGVAELAEWFATRYLPVARATPGLVRFHVAVRPVADAHSLAVVTLWDSAEAALAAYGGDLDTPRTLAGLAEPAILTGVAYFEVDETQVRRSSADAAILRIAIGRIEQGADAAIQQELRARLLHEIDETMTEAYVGRRMVGTDVEVAYISAWEHVPPGRSLDEPFWPEISARFRSFLVEAYLTILSGPSVEA